MSFELARSEFDKLCVPGLRVEDLPVIASAQVRVAAAHVVSFGAAPDSKHVGKLFEEVGELADELDRGARGDPVRPEAIRGELGDVLIVSSLLATSHRLDWAVIISDAQFAASVVVPTFPVAGAGVARVVNRHGTREQMFLALVGLCASLQEQVAAPSSWGMRTTYVEAVDRVIRRWRSGG